MQFKQYPSYKNSGVEWLGGVPEHWDVKRLKYLFSIKNGATPKSNVSQFWDGDIKWVTPSDLSKLESHEIAESSRTITVEGFNSCGTNLVPAGSIIVSCRAPIGSLAITLTSLCTNQGCKSLVASKILNIKFYFYFLSISADKLNSLGNGTTFLELSSFELKNLSILAPRLEEQTQIANYLDTETTRIDNLIAKQEKLIELLEEQRKSIISHAVTKGLNPNAPMKDSGVEWLGDVPEHWSENKIKFVSKLITDKTANKSNVIALENIESWTAKLVSSNSDFDSDGICFKKNDVLFGKLRPYLAKVYLAESKGEAIGDIYVLRPNNLINPKFLKFFMLSEKFIDYVNSSTNGTKMPRANWDFIGSISIFLPHTKIQHEIVEYLDSAVLKIELIINKQKSLIEKLKEYRASIISHAVTGKIDVREFGA